MSFWLQRGRREPLGKIPGTHLAILGLCHYAFARICIQVSDGSWLQKKSRSAIGPRKREDEQG